MTNYDSDRGRFGKVFGARVLDWEDVAQLQRSMGKGRMAGQTITTMRERYFALARLLAIGHPLAEAARMIRMSYNNAYVISRDPTFLEAVAEAKAKVEGQVFSEHARTLEMMETAKQMAWSQIIEQLEDAEAAGDKIALNRLIAIAAESSDRTGHAKTQVNVNMDGDIAAKIEFARQRSAKVLNLRSRPFPGSVTPPTLEHSGLKGVVVSSAPLPPRLPPRQTPKAHSTNGAQPTPLRRI